ncbi:hypothetical protein GCK72_011167 [Caenorhabditis remanei]|uniref:RING-type domain-containing protein n=1 Tax=Caenorhabditis remanei TaxID=31234 RepID=A0A6A5H900_CAERE|nr:hypothetical protein GCK72_011167 [Caenorhabditis remanei]KAF1762903.1 hypothetical protein GCK72_011167 [Caenorhabditis remanei]
MTKYLEINEDAYTPMHFAQKVFSYILKEFPTQQISFDFPQKVKGNEEEIVRMLCDELADTFRMYGSPREIVENVKKFTNFPENWRHLGLEEDTYQTNPMIYRSLKNEKYLCKSDLFPILQNMVFGGMNEFINVMAIFLKSQEPSDCMEFVRFDEKVLEEIAAELSAESWQKQVNISPMELQEMSALSLEEYFEKTEKMIGGEWNPKKSLRVQMDFRRMRMLSPEVPILFVMTLTYHMQCSGIEPLRKIIKKHPEWFLPYSETGINNIPTVRLLEDGDQRFVLKAELSNAIGVRLDSEDDGNLLFTVGLEEVLRKYGTKKIEFIRYPIVRTKHRAVPIKGPTPSKEFFILTVDAFFEFFRSLTIGLKMFQNTDFSRFLLAFHELEKYFKPDCKTPYFIRTDSIDSMKKIVETFRGEAKGEKSVRNAKPDGFTIQDLKNELKHLELVETFPEIKEHAEVIYEHVNRVKNEKYLRTCDLFDAIEYCQLICILNRLPNLQMFLHNQNGCGRVIGYKCERCEKKETSDVKNSTKNLKSESSNESVLNQYSQMALFAPKNCEKCSESSKTLEETESELKISQDQEKKMQQKITNREKELSDLKKEYEIFLKSEAKKTEELAEMKEELNSEKEKNQKKEEEILKTSQENEELQKTILKLTAENEANERVIQKLLDRITNLSISNQKTDKIDGKTIEGSTATASITSKTAPLVVDCLICSSQIKSGEEVIRCPLCKRRFHSNCAFKWLKDHTQCPACNGDLPGI